MTVITNLTGHDMDKKIAFIGAGNMAEAMVKGLVTSGMVGEKDITVTDSSAHRLLHMKQTYGVGAVTDNADAPEGRDVVVLAVKPQVIDAVMAELAPKITDRQLVVSIAAGVTVARIKAALGEHARVVRVMPNTPSLVREGAAAMYAGAGCTEQDVEAVHALMSSICGVVVRVAAESQMDAVTGLSGSGPAYVFLILEAMSDAGVRMGLPREESFRLAAQTLLGSARMAIETLEPLCRLKDMVTSPGGTTIAGLQKLEDAGVRAAMYAAVEAATLRSRELGKV